MFLKTGLLVLESLLLLATVVLLAYSLREGRHRDRLLLQMSKTTKILTRQEYFLAVLDSMMDAQEEVVGCISGRLPVGDDKKMTRDIAETIQKLTARNVSVQYMLPKFPDRLHVGYLYTMAGAKIYYITALTVHNLRFMTIDEHDVVIGIPEDVGETQATRKGFRIPSEGLAVVLKRYFESCDKATGFREYVEEVLQQTGASVQHLAREYEIDEIQLRKMIERTE